MSNGWRLELLKWGDSDDTLAYWDSWHGVLQDRMQQIEAIARSEKGETP